MTDLSARFATAIGEVRALGAVLGTVTDADWGRPTPCDDWTIAELADHVSAVGFQQAEAFHRARVGGTDAPGELSLRATGAELAMVVAQSADHLAAAEALMQGRAWPPIPMPFMTLPAPSALGAIIIEHAFHTHDLHQALGRDEPLSAAGCDALLELGDAFLVLQARPAEADAIGFELVAPSKRMVLGWDGDEWSDRLSPGMRPCTIEGSDEAIALFMMQRLPADSPELAITGRTELADRFRRLVQPL